MSDPDDGVGEAALLRDTDGVTPPPKILSNTLSTTPPELRVEGAAALEELGAIGATGAAIDAARFAGGAPVGGKADADCFFALDASIAASTMVGAAVGAFGLGAAEVAAAEETGTLVLVGVLVGRIGTLLTPGGAAAVVATMLEIGVATSSSSCPAMDAVATGMKVLSTAFPGTSVLRASNAAEESFRPPFTWAI